MGAPSTTRHRLDQQLHDFRTATELAINTIHWQRDQDRHDAERLAEIQAGIARALMLQDEARHLDWRLERLARGYRFWSSPRWKRGWLRLCGKAPVMRLNDFPPSTEWSLAS